MKKVLLIACVLSVIIACSTAPTKPNISAVYNVPALKSQLEPISSKAQTLAQEPLPVRTQALFQKIYLLDPVLALELGRLPEFQDKVGERQILALTRFTDLIINSTPEEKANLANLLEVGKSNIRRYCAPLQAIYWLMEEDKKLLKNPLQNSLRDILNSAWDFTDYNRWGDYETVTDRLNSPELINFFEGRNFRYESHVGSKCLGHSKSIFKYKVGCCLDYTAFSEYCLLKAGYDAGAIQVVSPTGHSYHLVCEYEDIDGKEYIMDNSCITCGSGTGITEKEIYIKELPIIGLGYRHLRN